MKIPKAQYSAMLEAIRPLAPKLAAHRLAVIREGSAQDVDKRVRWDALWSVEIDGLPPYSWIDTHLYRFGVQDAHIDTALRSIMRELGIS